MCYAESKDETAVRTYDFERSELICAECLQGHGFVWYKLRESATGDREQGGDDGQDPNGST